MKRKSDREGGPASFGTFDRDLSIVREDNFMDQRQSQSGSFFFGSIKGEKNLIKMFSGNAGPRIGNLNGQPPRRAIEDRDADLALLLHRLQRILNYIRKSLPDQGRIDRHFR